MNDNRIALRGYIEEMFEPFCGEKNIITKFRIRHMHLGSDGRENGEQTIYEVAAYNGKGDVLTKFAKNMKVEVVARLFSWKNSSGKFDGMNMQLRLSEIKICAGNIINMKE